MLVSDLDCVKFLFKFVDVLLLGHFHLLQDFLLSMQFTIEVFSLGYWFVYLVLEFDVLFMQYLDLSIGCIELDLSILYSKHLIFEVASSSEKLSICGCMFFLLFFVPLNPHVTSLFLACNNLLQVVNPLIELLFG